jgi:hypothetical protein
MNYEQNVKTSHILHLLLSIITGGIWIFIWVLCVINTCIENARIDKRNNKKEEEYLKRSNK